MFTAAANSVSATLANAAALGLNYQTYTQEASLGVYVVYLCVTAAAIPVAYLGLVKLKEVSPPITTLQAGLPLPDEMRSLASSIKRLDLLILLLPSFACDMPTVAISTMNGTPFQPYEVIIF
jgi:hypothetical protein